MHGQVIHSAVGLLLALLKKAVARYSNANERSARFCKRTSCYLTSAEHSPVRLTRDFLWHLQNHF